MGVMKAHGKEGARYRKWISRRNQGWSEAKQQQQKVKSQIRIFDNYLHLEEKYIWAGSTGPVSLGKQISQPLSRPFPCLSTFMVISFTRISVKIPMLQPVAVVSCSSPTNPWTGPGSVFSLSLRWVAGDRNKIFLNFLFCTVWVS